MTTEADDRLEAARTFPAFIRAIAEAYGDEPAVSLRNPGAAEAVLSFRGLDQQSADMARGLLAQGTGKGARIGFLCGNGPLFVAVLAAIARIGAVAVPISTLLKGDELVRVLRQSDVAGLIVQRSLLGHDLVERLCAALPALREAGASAGALRLPRAPYLRWIASTGDDLPPAILPLDALAPGSVDEELLRAVEAEVHPNDQMVEIYTSGSMAAPKGVKHNHGPVVFRGGYIARMTGRTRGAESYVAMPMFWVGGLGIFLLPSLYAGAHSVCTDATFTDSRMAMGSVLSADDLKLMANARPYWGLGMSETFGPYSYGDEFRAEGYPVCAPLDNVADRYEMRVVDEEGRPVGDGAIGEIQVRGYAVTPGLHKIDREPYFTADGFYRTGDLGLREGKRVHFVGRDGDMIKTSGSNVSPAEVEMEMQALDGVHSAYVVGIPDPQRGQMVVAAVVARDGVTLDFEGVQAALKQRLSGFKVPRAFVEITRGEVPMLPSNKVARREIARLMTERLAVPG